MDKQSTIVSLRIGIGSTDRYNHELVYETIVFKAREYGLSGATVVKGILGFGASSVIHSYKFWEVSEKLPVIIEIIDEEDKILSFFEQIRPMLEDMRYGCLVTTQPVNVLLQKSGRSHS